MPFLIHILSGVLIMTLLFTGCSLPASVSHPAAAQSTATGGGVVRRTTPVPVPAETTTSVAPQEPAPSVSSTPAPIIPTPAEPAVSPGSPPALLDVGSQAAALLPDFATDLALTPAWDQYRIHATLDPAALTVSGTQQVQVHNTADVPFEALYFHLYPNHPDFGGSLQVTDVRVQDQPVDVSTEQDGVLLRVPLPQPLAPGASVQVTMNFLAATQRNASGQAYGAFNQEAGVWSLASFYPVLARYFADGWDRRPVSSQGDLAVTETALYEVTLDTPTDWQLVTTGVRVAVDPQGSGSVAEGYRRERFVSGPQRDFFLAALNGLDQASVEVDGTRLTSYYQPGDTAAGQRSLRVAEQSLRAFNTRYGRYPLVELDVIQAALTSFLGVEYPGVMLIEQNLYRNNGRGLETTVAHEVAHQWWYSQVGNDYQGEPWLDEGLASFSQIVYYEALGDATNAAAELQFFRDVYQGARNAGRDGIVSRPTGTFRGNYVALVYAKSALFFQALRERMGDEAFFNFLQRYYTTYRYREATGPDMLAVAEDTCACDLQPLYDAWINSTAPVEVP